MLIVEQGCQKSSSGFLSQNGSPRNSGIICVSTGCHCCIVLSWLSQFDFLELQFEVPEVEWLKEFSRPLKNYDDIVHHLFTYLHYLI